MTFATFFEIRLMVTTVLVKTMILRSFEVFSLSCFKFHSWGWGESSIHYVGQQHLATYCLRGRKQALHGNPSHSIVPDETLLTIKQMDEITCCVNMPRYSNYTPLHSKRCSTMVWMVHCHCREYSCVYYGCGKQEPFHTTQEHKNTEEKVHYIARRVRRTL